MRHGTASTYRNHGCRCVDCREAQRVKITAERRRRGVRPIGETQQPLKHGTTYAYRHVGCRCPPCRAANTEAVAKYRAQRKTTA